MYVLTFRFWPEKQTTHSGCRSKMGVLFCMLPVPIFFCGDVYMPCPSFCMDSVKV